jgi:hypothetical protein
MSVHLNMLRLSNFTDRITELIRNSLESASLQQDHQLPLKSGTPVPMCYKGHKAKRQGQAKANFFYKKYIVKLLS